jgi:hypothetical protein
MGTASLADLRRLRAFRCRLDPARALGSTGDAAGFLDDRGILTRTAGCSLPSLFAACHQPAYREGGRGFAAWPATAYAWFGELAGRPGVVELAVHHGKRVLLTAPMAALADPLCRAELEREDAAGGDAAALLDHLRTAGPTTVDDVKLELGWDAARLRRARRGPERTGALVARSTTLPAAAGGHVHTSVLCRWDQALPAPSGRGSLEDVLVACVDAAVLAEEAELRRWFSWQPQPDARLIGRLVADGRLCRPAPGWLSLGG